MSSDIKTRNRQELKPSRIPFQPHLQISQLWMTVYRQIDKWKVNLVLKKAFRLDYENRKIHIGNFKSKIVTWLQYGYVFGENIYNSTASTPNYGGGSSMIWDRLETIWLGGLQENVFIELNKQVRKTVSKDCCYSCTTCKVDGWKIWCSGSFQSLCLI